MPKADLPSFSAKELLILRLLANEPEMYGLQLVEQSGGRLKRGTVYVTLGRMEEKGFVTSEQERREPHSSGIPRRLYRIAGLGQRVLREVDQRASAFAVLRVRFQA